MQALAVRRTSTVHRVSVRHYARPGESAEDSRTASMRRMLYPSTIKNKPSPVGTWRHDVGKALQRAVPSKQAHQTIQRAWALHQRRIREKRESELQRKWDCMHKAMERLRVLDKELYDAANRKDDPKKSTPEEKELSKSLRGAEKRAFDGRIRGLFPREMRLPSDTPSYDGWKYDWKPLPDNLDGKPVA